MMQRLEKNYYRIREVAEILGIPVTTLRFWEKQFTIIKPRRTTSGQRLYTPADIDKVAMICYLVRDKGMRLDAAEEQLRSNPKGVERGSRALMRLRVVRAELAEMIKAIR
ncbi:MAG: MerR family transcriptional regulator [Muribaculaceae bacterium]|nr:MerR family transcriptional regulator [Muribaculaceae bacterium]